VSDHQSTISPALARAIELLAESRAEIERMIAEERERARVDQLEREVEALKRRLEAIEQQRRP
jgi:polyhydroxyalkanoate synthesis regulator phasin